VLSGILPNNAFLKGTILGNLYHQNTTRYTKPRCDMDKAQET
jgi:hypothetical protein